MTAGESWKLAWFIALPLTLLFGCGGMDESANANQDTVETTIPVPPEKLDPPPGCLLCTCIDDDACREGCDLGFCGVDDVSCDSLCTANEFAVRNPSCFCPCARGWREIPVEFGCSGSACEAVCADLFVEFATSLAQTTSTNGKAKATLSFAPAVFSASTVSNSKGQHLGGLTAWRSEP